MTRLQQFIKYGGTYISATYINEFDAHLSFSGSCFYRTNPTRGMKRCLLLIIRFNLIENGFYYGLLWAVRDTDGPLLMRLPA